VQPNAQAPNKADVPILAIKNTCAFDAKISFFRCLWHGVATARLCRKFLNFACAFDAESRRGA
jgi:hypothetical protein